MTDLEFEERLENGAGTTNGGGGGGGGAEGPAWGILLAFQLVSNTIWRLRHTDEGCSDSRKLCKCCQIFILSNTVVTCTECYITRIDEST